MATAPAQRTTAATTAAATTKAATTTAATTKAATTSAATTATTKAATTTKTAAAPDPEAARAALRDFLGDEDYVGGLDEDRVLELHGKVVSRKADGTWPEDWRDQIAGNDEKILKRLGRYASPRDVANALLAAQNRISSGELRPALKDGASEEELAAWREEMGLPAKPEDYNLDLPEGIVFGEADKPFIDSFVKAAHGANMTEAQVKSALAWYHADREAQIQAMADRDATDAQATDDALHAEWGADFPLNRNRIFALLDTLPTGVKDMMMDARGPDDKALFNNIDFLRGMDQIARQLNPVATRVRGGSDNIEGSIDAELADLTKMMGSKTSAYWKGPKSEALQARYRELVEAKDRLGQGKKRAA